ncbi:hypothetical protein [Streptomyces sioyaensis]|uniref:hypothetical protein n=1 Tax=Streptomyces sioyaensis TaxID=67364 RepID=UPI003713D85A
MKWHRHITRLDGIERQAAQELSPLPFTALIEVQLMARDCQWLLDGYKENWRVDGEADARRADRGGRSLMSGAHVLPHPADMAPAGA